MAQLPEIDFSHIVGYEKEDATEVKKELACVGGVCEIDEFASTDAPHGRENVHTRNTELI